MNLSPSACCSGWEAVELRERVLEATDTVQGRRVPLLTSNRFEEASQEDTGPDRGSTDGAHREEFFLQLLLTGLPFPEDG
jgi:hypothetical protein